MPSGVAKIFAYKKGPGTFGTASAGGAGAQILRRVEADFMTEVDTFESDEIAPTFQTTDVQVGQQRSKGTVRGRFSGKTVQDFIAGHLRQLFQVPSTTGALITVTAAVAGPQYTRSAGSFLTDGFRVGSLVNWIGWTAPATNNNNRYFIITALTATQMTGFNLDGTPVVAKAAGDSVTCVEVGKKTWFPQSGHTKDLFDFEEYQPDLASTSSELWVSMFANTMQMALDPKGYFGIDFGYLGAKQTNASGAPYFTAPTGITSNRLHNMFDGALYVNGTAVTGVTGFTINSDNQAALSDPEYQSRTPVDVFPGRHKLSGNMTVYWRDNVLRDAYLARQKVSFIGISRQAALAQSDTAVIVIPSVTLLGADKNDQQTGGTIRTFPFQADNNVGSTGSDQTTISFQDSLAT